MGYYVYAGTAKLGSEKVGADGRIVWRDIRSDLVALMRARKLFGDKPFMLYRYANFYDDKTFTLINS